MVLHQDAGSEDSVGVEQKHTFAGSQLNANAELANHLLLQRGLEIGIA